MFTISKIEKIKSKDFVELHSKCYAGAIGGSISYKFTPTGIGNIVEVECNICKEKINITDFDSW